jgi:hypothetical protein
MGPSQVFKPTDDAVQDQRNGAHDATSIPEKERKQPKSKQDEAAAKPNVVAQNRGQAAHCVYF